MTYEELFDWIEENNASVIRGPNTKWTREDGSQFYSNFSLCSHNTQWPAFPTLKEAVEYAEDYLWKTRYGKPEDKK
jgi:hypothetical protein